MPYYSFFSAFIGLPMLLSILIFMGNFWGFMATTIWSGTDFRHEFIEHINLIGLLLGFLIILYTFYERVNAKRIDHKKHSKARIIMTKTIQIRTTFLTFSIGFLFFGSTVLNFIDSFDSPQVSAEKLGLRYPENGIENDFRKENTPNHNTELEEKEI